MPLGAGGLEPLVCGRSPVGALPGQGCRLRVGSLISPTNAAHSCVSRPRGRNSAESKRIGSRRGPRPGLSRPDVASSDASRPRLEPATTRRFRACCVRIVASAVNLSPARHRQGIVVASLGRQHVPPPFRAKRDRPRPHDRRSRRQSGSGPLPDLVLTPARFGTICNSGDHP